MGLFGLLSGRRKLPTVVHEAAAAMAPQIAAAQKVYSSAATFDARLASEGTAAFLHGFVLCFAAKHGMRAPELLWAATVQTFEQVFGRPACHAIITSLQQSLRQGTARRWVDGGANAARYFDEEGLDLLKSFLEGGAS